MQPILAINFKVYPTSFGDKGITIAKAAEKVEGETGVKIILCVPSTEISRISSKTNVEIFAQHVDSLLPGAGTGYVTVEMLKEAGAKGSILNHSEHRLRIDEIEETIKRLKENGLKSLVCGNTPNATACCALLGADIVAMEPPELIGSGISVSNAKPELITETIKKIKGLGLKTKILVGAGISNKDDCKRSIELGADGVLLSSIVMKSTQPYQKILELAEGLIS
ncbi:MAG: triose-phosphate isomerase [Candidatus Micrarchaeia archaeon]